MSTASCRNARAGSCAHATYSTAADADASAAHAHTGARSSDIDPAGT